MLTPGTITVTFTANYAGPHRICWRQCGVGPFVCTNIVDCAGGGNVCSATVSIMVDPESCTPVCFEGYIQATCNPEGSPVDQVPWSANFVPAPTCNLYDLVCNNPLGCPTIPSASMGLNCVGTPRPDVGPINPLGPGIKVCAQIPISNLPADYSMSLLSPNCCECSQYSVSITPACPSCILDGTSLYYTDCVTKELIKVTYTGNVPIIFNQCAITDTLSVETTVESIASVGLIGLCP